MSNSLVVSQAFNQISWLFSADGITHFSWRRCRCGYSSGLTVVPLVEYKVCSKGGARGKIMGSLKSKEFVLVIDLISTGGNLLTNIFQPKI